MGGVTLDVEKLRVKEELLLAGAGQGTLLVALLDEGNHDVGNRVSKVVHIKDDAPQAVELADEDVSLGGLVHIRGNVNEARQADSIEGALLTLVVEAGNETTATSRRGGVH